MKSKTWIIVIAAALLLSIILSLPVLLGGANADFAQVYSDGELLYTLSLHEDTQKTVHNGDGTNVITVKDGKIAVTKANCPDGHCIARGYCDGGVQIVCLPNRLVIKFGENQGVDTVVG